MLKDLKEKVKYISEIVGMISITGTLIAIITATVYDFGFFAYFSTYLWNIPISISEILRDTVVIFPKITLTFITTLFFWCLLIPIWRAQALFFRKVREIKYKIIHKINNIFYKNRKNIREEENINEEQNKEKNNYKELFPIEILLFFLFITYLLMIIKDLFVLNPFIYFSLVVMLIFIKHKNNSLKHSVYKWIIGISIFYLINLFFVGIYDANQETYIQKYNKDYVVMKNGKILDNLKILKVYDSGIFAIKSNDSSSILNFSKSSFVEKPKEMNLEFIYSTEVDKYCMQNRSINIIKRNFLIDYDAFSNIDIKRNWWLFLVLFLIVPILIM